MCVCACVCVFVCVRFGSFQGVRHGLDSVLAEEARSDDHRTPRRSVVDLSGILGAILMKIFNICGIFIRLPIHPAIHRQW